MTFGVVVAFIQYAERFYQPVRDLSEKYNMIQSAMVASERIFELLDTPPGDSRARRAARDRTARAARSSSTTSGSPTRTRSGCCATSRSGSRPGEKVAIVGATGAGQDHHRQPALPVLRVPEGLDPRGRRRHPRDRGAGAAAADRPRAAGRVPVLGQRAGERRLRRPRAAAATRSIGRSPRSAARGSRRGCRTGWTRRWASAARTCRWASGRSSPSRARSTTTRAS